MVIEQSELDAAAAELDRIVMLHSIYRRPFLQARYETWCYCSWCPRSARSTPHYRRDGECPNPVEYAW